MARRAPLPVVLAFTAFPMGAAGSAPAPPTLPEATVIEVESPPDAVTLYRGRAAVTRRVVMTLDPGLYDLRFVRLPRTVDGNTLQARARGPARVIETEYSQRRSTEAAPEALQRIDATIKGLEDDLHRLDDRGNAIQKERSFLESIADKAAQGHAEGSGTGAVDLEAVEQQMRFLGAQHELLLEAQRVIDRKAEDLREQLKVLRDRRKAMAAGDKILRAAVVTIGVLERGAVKVDLVYVVTEATWSPRYNIRAEVDGDEVLVEYDAMLTQRTGEDWDDVAMILSTSQPARAASPPVPSPWYVTVAPPPQDDTRRTRSFGGGTPAAMESLGKAADVSLGVQMHWMTANASVEGGGPAVVFVLPRTVSVPTDAQQHQRTRISSFESEAEFTHVAVPLLTESVYLRADLVNTLDAPVLPGPASVFLGPDYIGGIQLGDVAPGEDLAVHFGVDPSLRATRELVEKTTAKRGIFMGGSRTLYRYRLTLTNGTDGKVPLELWDRIPVSRNEAIRIELENLSDPLSTDATWLQTQRLTGLLRWDLVLEPGTTGTNVTTVTYGLDVNVARNVETTPLPE